MIDKKEEKEKQKRRKHVERLLAEADVSLKGEARRALAVSLLKEGIKPKPIASRLGVHYVLVYRWCKEEGLTGKWREFEGKELASPRFPTVREMKRKRQTAQAVKMLKAGVNRKKVAEKLGVVEHTVRRWVKDHERRTGEKIEVVGVERRGRREKVKDGMARAVQMRKDGMSAAEIARELKVDVSHVHSWIRKYNAQEGVEPIPRWGKKADREKAES